MSLARTSPGRSAPDSWAPSESLRSLPTESRTFARSVGIEQDHGPAPRRRHFKRRPQELTNDHFGVARRMDRALAAVTNSDRWPCERFGRQPFLPVRWPTSPSSGTESPPASGPRSASTSPIHRLALPDGLHHWRLREKQKHTLAKAHFIAVPELSFLDRNAIHERSIAAVEIADHAPPVPRAHHAMPPRNRRMLRSSQIAFEGSLPMTSSPAFNGNSEPLRG